MGLEFKTDINGNPIPRVPEGNTQDKGLLHNSKEQIVVPGGSVPIIADTWTTIPNNGAGSFSNDTYKPLNVTELMDVSTGAIDTTELELGDTIIIRNDFTINPNTNNALVEFRYGLGGNGNEYTLTTTLGRLDDGSGKNYRFSLTPDLIYMGDENTRLNPIILQVKLSTNGTLTNAGSVIQVIKRNV